VSLGPRFATLALAAFGCGTPAESETAPAPVAAPSSSTRVDVTYVLDDCPDFYAFTLEPRNPGLETPTAVTVQASDPEGDPINYSWSARAGRLRDVLENRATYQCIELGPDTITVVAADDKNCQRTLNIRVSCSAD
jgi:hypothetical protein